MCLSVKGVTSYNSLPNAIKTAPSMGSFKNEMKKMYFEIYNKD